MHRSKKKRNIIIISLVGILLCMVVGYSAFQTKLEIKGTSKVTSNWDIEITNVTEGTSTGSGENTVAPTWTKLTASMEANLYDKGDAMEYDVTIENKGTLDAKLNDILTNLENNNSKAVLITFSGYTKGEVLKAKTSKVVHVKIEYNPEYEGGETSSEVEINFDYVQNNNEENNPDNQYLLTYDYKTNGGTNVELKEEYLTVGSNVDLTNAATKEGWTFVGWNTNKDAEIGLTTYQMPNSNITLYAIYSKTLKVTYQKGENIESIGKVEDSCNIYNNNTSCEITLPEITASNGYNVNGWYNGNNKVGNMNEKYNINNNLNLISKAIDNIKPTTPTITNSSNGNWTNQNIVVTLKSVDEGSGIDHYEWNNNGVWTSSNIIIKNGIGTITFNVDNNSNIEFRSVDKARNISEVSSTPIKRDTIPPTCTSSGESSKWIALTQTIKGTCIDSGSRCKNSQISKTYSIAENITGNYDSSYSPGTVSDNAGNSTVCPNVRVRVTGTTLKDYTSGAVFMYDGKTGLNNTTWQDQSGNNRNGTLVGAVKSGNSVYFDGVNDYVRIGTLSHSQLSLESVIKPTAANKPDVVVLGNFENGGVGLNLSYQTATFKAYKGNNYVYPAFVKINLNGTNYIGGSANSSLVKNYINGALSQVNNSSAIVPPRNNEPFLIGANPYKDRLNDEDFYFKGYVYAARMYSKVLTDDELQKHYVIDKWRFNF